MHSPLGGTHPLPPLSGECADGRLHASKGLGSRLSDGEDPHGEGKRAVEVLGSPFQLVIGTVRETMIRFDIQSSGSLSNLRLALRKAYDATSCRSSRENDPYRMSILHVEVVSAGC